VVIVVLVATYIIKESHRKRAHKLKKNVNELEQEVSGLEQSVDDLVQEVSCLEQEVSGLELEVSKQKGRYAVLFDMYKQGYNVDRKTMVVDAQKNLNKLHEEYTDLTKTDLTIIWLTFMDCSRDMICDLMNITQKYYYQRKSLIQQILGIPIRNEEGWNKTLESIVMRYINELNIPSELKDFLYYQISDNETKEFLGNNMDLVSSEKRFIK
jgi:predicted nucleotide-binding protein (sugar kinase/HSP70/actin superfamily)